MFSPSRGVKDLLLVYKYPSHLVASSLFTANLTQPKRRCLNQGHRVRHSAPQSNVSSHRVRNLRPPSRQSLPWIVRRYDSLISRGRLHPPPKVLSYKHYHPRRPTSPFPSPAHASSLRLSPPLHVQSVLVSHGARYIRRQARSVTATHPSTSCKSFHLGRI